MAPGPRAIGTPEAGRRIFGQGSSASSRLGYRLSMVAMRDELVARVGRHHPFVPLPEVHRAAERTSELLGLRTNGGSALTVGSVAFGHRIPARRADRLC